MTTVQTLLSALFQKDLNRTRSRARARARARKRDRQTKTETDRHRQTDRETDRQADRQAGRQTHRQIGRQRQTDRDHNDNFPLPGSRISNTSPFFFFFFFSALAQNYWKGTTLSYRLIMHRLKQYWHTVKTCIQGMTTEKEKGKLHRRQ